MTRPFVSLRHGGARLRIVVVGGGFGGVHAARRLERAFRDRPDIAITLVSRENHFVITPLLFELWSDSLEARHAAAPIRTALRRTRFVEATVRRIDVERRIVHTVAGEEEYALDYDHLVVALGAETNRRLVPGSEHALTFKSVADAVTLRNHVIERLERADAERHPEHKRRLLTFVVVGGGLVGVELMGELTAFAHDVVRHYPRVRREELRFLTFEAGPRILPELPPELARYAGRVLAGRGVDIRAATPVRRIEPGVVHLSGERVETDTIVLAAGIAPNAAIADIALEKDARGRIVVDATMRSATRPEVWALGDAATVPDPDGRPYPALAQIAVQQARVLATNIRAAVDGGTPRPFVYGTKGILAALGGRQAVGTIYGVMVRGIVAWWGWRLYYLFQMPRWSRRMRMLFDRMAARFFRPDIVKVEATPEAPVEGAPDGRDRGRDRAA